MEIPAVPGGRGARQHVRWPPVTLATVTDAGIAIGVAVLATLGEWKELSNSPWPTPPGPGAYLLTVGAATALLGRRHHPLAVLVSVLVLVVGYHELGYPGEAIALALPVAVFTLAAEAPRVREVALALAVAVGAGLIPVLPRTG